MQRYSDFVIQFYKRLLRLDPPQFRAEYAEEMQDVFAQAVHENENSLSLLGLLLAEIRDLPVSIIRERLWERRQPVLTLEDIMVRQSYYSPQLFWFLARMLVCVGLYFCSAVAAYFVFDLRVNAWDRAWEWWNIYDSNPSYIGNILPLGLAVVCFWLIAPVGMVIGGTLLALMLWRQWPNLTRQMRWWGICAVLAGAAMFLTMGSPIGYMAALWFYD